MSTIEERAIVTSEDREAWLRARRTGVTATEIAKLERGGASFGRILKEKLTGEESFTGNRYTAWGSSREGFISAWIQERFDIAPCGMLYHADGNEKHLATPDGMGTELDGSLVLSEIKTANHDLTQIPRDYYIQMLWQMYVTGAKRVLFVWEQHDDDWPEPSPLEAEPRFQWVERDDDEIARLVVVADQFLLELAAEPAEAEWDLELDELARDVLAHRALESAEKVAKETSWKAIIDRVATRGNYTQKSRCAQVTYSMTTTTTTVPDESAARAANPELAAKFDEVTTEWAEYQAHHTKQSKSTSSKLTVTAVKEK